MNISTGEEKQRETSGSYSAFLEASGKAREACKEQQRMKDGWHPYQSPRVGQVATVWPEQPRAHKSGLFPTGQEVSGRGSEKSAVHFQAGF